MRTGSIGWAVITAAAVAAAGASTFCAPALAQDAMAIVVQDQTPLRAAPHDSAPQQAVLWQGDLLELRGGKLDQFQVYDHRRERAGYVRSGQVRRISLTPADAPQLLALVRFLRDTPGSEALGIAYAAAYLKAAPAATIDAEPFDAIGTMAERLARQASARQASPDDAGSAAHLDVAASYGISITSVERDDRMQLCYDGDAFRRVLTLPATAEQRARATLALTRDDCIAPTTLPLAREQQDDERAALLDRVDTSALGEPMKNRIHLRRAGVWASIAFERSRHGTDAASAASDAWQALAAVNKPELSDDDRSAYAEAAVRVNASRWAADAVPAATPRLAIVTRPGQPGETCVSLVDPRHDAAHALMTRCTFGTVWASSVAVNATGSALAVAVQPLASWRELWLFHRTAEGWVADVLPPSTGDTQLGVIEFAGWVPGDDRLLVAREARVDGRFRRSFEVMNLATLASEKQADKPESISLFYRWQDAGWKRQSTMLR